jgi:hypothetical protein
MNVCVGHLYNFSDFMRNKFKPSYNNANSKMMFVYYDNILKYNFCYNVTTLNKISKEKKIAYKKLK